MSTNINEQINNAQRKKQVLLNIREEALAEKEEELADSIELRILKLDEIIQTLTTELNKQPKPYNANLQEYRGSTQLEDSIAKLIINQAKRDSIDANIIFSNAFAHGINTGIFTSLVYANDFKQFFIAHMYEILDEYNVLHKHDMQYEQLDVEDMVSEVILAIMHRIAIIIGIIRLD